jgi:hypothetical protein
MRKFIAWLFGIKWQDIGPTYYHCYGFGAHMRVLGDKRCSNPYTYGTLEHDAWNDGWEGRK